jgi:hypothetical protein
LAEVLPEIVRVAMCIGPAIGVGLADPDLSNREKAFMGIPN